MAHEIKTKTLSEIIAELEALKAQYGDIEVAAGTEDGGSTDINIYIDNPDDNPTLNLYC
jgi:hypothetical protein